MHYTILLHTNYGELSSIYHLPLNPIENTEDSTVPVPQETQETQQPPSYEQKLDNVITMQIINSFVICLGIGVILGRLMWDRLRV